MTALAADGIGLSDPESLAFFDSTLRNPPEVVTAEAVAGGPGLAGVRWTFGYLQALGMAAALLAVVGLLLYLRARQVAREVSYALSSRRACPAARTGWRSRWRWGGCCWWRCRRARCWHCWRRG